MSDSMPTPGFPRATEALVAAALAGLLVTASGCNSSEGAAQSAGSVAACDGGMPATPTITSSEVRAMTEQEFRDLCTQKGGTFEIEPHCGGLNSCRGLSYDTGTQTLTDHSCRGANTCAGFSCIVCG